MVEDHPSFFLCLMFFPRFVVRCASARLWEDVYFWAFQFVGSWLLFFVISPCSLWNCGGPKPFAWERVNVLNQQDHTESDTFFFQNHLEAQRVNNPRFWRVLFLPQSWKLKTAIFERQLLLEMHPFLTSMIMGGRVTFIHGRFKNLQAVQLWATNLSELKELQAEG